MIKEKLFGTDGIRQKVGLYPLDDTSVYKLGRVIGELISVSGTRIGIGRDTRSSGEHLAKLIASGILHTSPHTEIYDLGHIPTPGLSFATDHSPLEFGIMITASHNPYTDNGIKIFGSDGEKLSQELEDEIERLFHSQEDSLLEQSSSIVFAPGSDGLKELYVRFLKGHASGIDGKINGTPIKIVLDCAEGATYQIAPLIFKEAGFDPVVIHAHPDGENINLGCGSTNTDRVREIVLTEKAHLGISCDGD